MEVHGIGKGLDPNIQTEKQIMKPITVTKMKEVCQVKPWLAQGRAGLRCKIKPPIPTPINKPIVQVGEKQPQILVPKTSKIQDIVTPIIQEKVTPIPN